VSTQIGIGFSQHKDGPAAAYEAAQQAKEQLRSDRIDFAIVFNSVNYNPSEFLPVLFKSLNQTRIIGSSTAGLILPNRIESHGLGVLVFHSDNITFETGFISHLDLQDMREAGKTFGQNSVTEFGHQNRKAFLFFVDGLMNNVSAMTLGLKDKLGQVFPIIGAGSSDDFHFRRTYQYQNDKHLSSGAAGVLFGGRPILAMSCKHGWKPLGKPRTVERSQGNIIKTIDGKSALSLYRDYFEEEAETLRANRLGQINVRYPLGIQRGPKQEYLLRNVVQVLDDESIVCQDTIHPDETVNIMIGNKETCLQAAEEAAAEISDQLGPKKPSVILVLESMFRYKLLRRSAVQEMQLIQRTVGEHIPVFGMYSYGETFSFKTATNTLDTVVNNGSLVLLALG
jgi:hypothetical protein